MPVNFACSDIIMASSKSNEAMKNSSHTQSIDGPWRFYLSSNWNWKAIQNHNDILQAKWTSNKITTHLVFCTHNKIFIHHSYLNLPLCCVIMATGGCFGFGLISTENVGLGKNTFSISFGMNEWMICEFSQRSFLYESRVKLYKFILDLFIIDILQNEWDFIDNVEIKIS